MLLIGAGHWQQLEQLVELDHAPAAPVAAGWMGPATVLGITTVLSRERFSTLSRAQSHAETMPSCGKLASGATWWPVGAARLPRRPWDGGSMNKALTPKRLA